MAAKKQKLDVQFNSERGFKSHIFDGVAVYVNGYTSEQLCFLSVFEPYIKNKTGLCSFA